ncbi:MAG: hypothetical protein ACK5KT_11465 [Dysgonomonas sp.]
MEIKGAFEELLIKENIEGKPAFKDEDLERFNEFVHEVCTDSMMKKQKAQIAASSLFLNR